MNTHIIYQLSTHAVLIKRYTGDGFEKVGSPPDSGFDFPRIDPETGAEYRALGGTDHSYNRDYKVGSSYPKNGFITGRNQEGDSLTHDELESVLRESSLWGDCLEAVILPKGIEYGDVTWWYGFKFTPVERAPRVSRMADQLEGLVEDPDYLYTSGPVVEAML